MDTITSPAAQMPTKEEMMAELRQLVEAGVATITDDRPGSPHISVSSRL